MIKLVKSTFYKEKIIKKKLISFIDNSNHLSFGRECEKFESNFSKWQGRKYCIYLNSGSSANLAIIQSLLNLGKLKRGDNVGFSALTWSTNVMPLIQLRLNPIPVDVSLNTLNATPQNLRTIITKTKLKVFFLTNLMGFCDEIKIISDICKKNKIILIEDNCESLGSTYKGRKLGNYGSLSSFSFYVGHHLSTIEGGAVCTDDRSLANMLRIIRAHGWDRNLNFTDRKTFKKKFKINSVFYSRYTFYDLGYNFRPTDINGFLGNSQLKYLDEIIKKREKNFLKIVQVINNNQDKYYSLKYKHMDVVSNFAIPVICRTKKIRDNLVKKCDKVIEIRPIVGGDITLQPFFKKYVRKKSYAKNPNASLVHKLGIYIGNNPELSIPEVNFIIKILKS